MLLFVLMQAHQNKNTCSDSLEMVGSFPSPFLVINRYERIQLKDAKLVINTFSSTQQNRIHCSLKLLRPKS